MAIGMFKRWFAVNLFILVCLSVAAELVRPVAVINSSVEVLSSAAGDSCAPIISPDGRYVLFASTAHNLSLTTNAELIPETFPARFNVYLRDRTNGTTVLVSANLPGNGGGNGDSMPTGLSTNDAYALFESTASDLIPDDTNKLADIFVRDLVNGTNILVSVKTNGGVANGSCRGSVLTPDGRYVAFVSAANNLVLDDTNGIPDVFVRDLQTSTTTLVSVGATATSVYTSSSEWPEISDDGRYIAFYSTATNLVTGIGTAGEIYVRDLVSNTTILASTNARAALNSVTGNSNAISYDHALSGDGKFVVYAASHISTNPFFAIVLRYNIDTGLTDLVYTNALVPYGPRENIRTLDMTPDGRFIAFLAVSSTAPSVRVWDSQSGSSVLVSADINNGVGMGNFECPAIDASGRFVAFTSAATNLTADAPDFRAHVFLRDLQQGETVIVDAGTNGISPNVVESSVPSMSADGRFIAFQGLDAQSGPQNPRRNFNLFLRDMHTNKVEVISVRHPALPSLSPDGASALSTLSVNRNGRFIAFASLASNVTANDTNANRDIFVRDLLNETNILVSIATNGLSATGMSFEPAISGNGQFVAFTSTASNLVPGDNNSKQDVFVFNLQTKAIALGSVGTSGAVGNNSSFSPIISEEGRYLLFRSKASNLALGTFAGENLFWRDLQNSNTVALTTAGITAMAVTPDGRYAVYQPTNTSSLYIWDSMAAARIYTNASFNGVVAAISVDGKRVAYVFGGQVQVFDRSPNTNWTIGAVSSVSRAGIKFSADGQFLTFVSSSSQGFIDSNGTFDVYLHHISSQTKTLVSRAHDFLRAASGISDSPDISFDGRFVAYRSAATNIIANDANGLPDVFLYDRIMGTNQLLSATQLGKSGNNISYAPVFSSDGRSLVFPSWASDLVENDFNQSGDLFAFALLYATITRVSGQPPLISWPATPGQSYQAQFKNNMDDANWQPVNGTVVITGNQGSIQDLSPGAELRVYRVVAF